MYRSRVSSFNHAQLLTHGNPIGLSAMTARLNGAAADSAEAVCTGDGQVLFSQAQHTIGERSAHLSYITPEPGDGHPGLPALLEFMCIRAGEMGAANLLAEVRESGHLLEDFRRSGFNIVGWETVWRLPMDPRLANTRADKPSWKKLAAREESAVRSLYCALVPPILQAVEPYRSDVANTLVYKHAGEVQAFVECFSGPKGIYLMPVIHPSLENPEEMLTELVEIFSPFEKPVYLQMRSFQAWLTTFLENMGAETSVHFALMSHRLAVRQYVVEENQELVVKAHRVQTTSPIVQKISRIGQ
jgi:hypothetical protein